MSLTKIDNNNNNNTQEFMNARSWLLCDLQTSAVLRLIEVQLSYRFRSFVYDNYPSGRYSFTLLHHNNIMLASPCNMYTLVTSFCLCIIVRVYCASLGLYCLLSFISWRQAMSLNKCIQQSPYIWQGRIFKLKLGWATVHV